jgi:hypothetical protein
MPAAMCKKEGGRGAAVYLRTRCAARSMQPLSRKECTTYVAGSLDDMLRAME